MPVAKVANCGVSFAGSGARTAPGTVLADEAAFFLTAFVAPSGAVDERAFAAFFVACVVESGAPAPATPAGVAGGRNGLAITLSGSAVRTSNSDFGRTKPSRFLNRIHGSCFSPPFAIFTSSHRPASFWPCSWNTSLPLRSPSRGSPIGSQWPRSQTMTVPAPYWPGGIVPSKLP